MTDCWKHGQADTFKEDTLTFVNLVMITFLVLVDSHSKWLEMIHINGNTSTEKTIHELRMIFASHGLQEEFVANYGPQFEQHHFSFS